MRFVGLPDDRAHGFVRKAQGFSGGTAGAKLARHMAKLEDILKTTSQREDLDELCNIIFGSDFEEMMKTRYMSYDELDEQRRELQDSVGGVIF